MERKYRVLIFGMTENPGGVETVLINYFRNVSQKKIHFDFLSNTTKEIAYENEIKKTGSHVYHICSRKKNPLKYWFQLSIFFKTYAKNYDCIWVNVNNLANIDYLKLAKKYGIKRRILHSHNSFGDTRLTKKILYSINKKTLNKYTTDYWACSKSAARWLYPQKDLKKVKIIKNAVDIRKERFNLKKREYYRQKYNLKGKIVLGNVGRLTAQKNQQKAIEIINNIANFKKNVCLVLVGQGEDLNSLRQLVKRLNVTDKVIFTGVQSDISAWYSTFDVLIFPSIYEGLPLVGIEAQANGLPIVSSTNALPDDAIINNNIKRIDLKESDEEWIKAILALKDKRLSYNDIILNFRNKGFEIKSAGKHLEKMFLSDLSKNG